MTNTTTKNTTTTLLSALQKGLITAIKADNRSTNLFVDWAADAKASGFTAVIFTDKTDTMHAVADEQLTGKQARIWRDSAIIMALWGKAGVEAWSTPAKERTERQDKLVRQVILPGLGSPRTRINRYLSGQTASGKERGTPAPAADPVKKSLSELAACHKRLNGERSPLSETKKKEVSKLIDGVIKALS